MEEQVLQYRHQPSFNFPSNSLKVCCLLTLYWVEKGESGVKAPAGLSLQELSLFVPASYSCLSTSLSKWTKWRLVKRQKVDSPAHLAPIFKYKLGAKGEVWVVRWWPYLPDKYKQLASESYRRGVESVKATRAAKANFKYPSAGIPG